VGEPVADLRLQGGGEGAPFDMQDAARGDPAVQDLAIGPQAEGAKVGRAPVDCDHGPFLSLARPRAATRHAQWACASRRRGSLHGQHP
jgi:hypothetical protein